MNKDEIAGLVDRWAEHGPETGKTLLEIAVSARMPDEKVNRWCQALQFCSTMADAQHDALTTLSARVETLEAEIRRYVGVHGVLTEADRIRLKTALGGNNG